MTDDPNADLIGYTFESDVGALTVTGTAPWSNAYVLCEGTISTCRVAAQLRLAKGLV